MCHEHGSEREKKDEWQPQGEGRGRVQGFYLNLVEPKRSVDEIERSKRVGRRASWEEPSLVLGALSEVTASRSEV